MEIWQNEVYDSFIPVHHIYIFLLFVLVYSTSPFKSRIQIQSMSYFLVMVKVTHNTYLLQYILIGTLKYSTT